MHDNRVLNQRETPVATYIDISEKLDHLVSQLSLSENNEHAWKRNYSTWNDLNTACNNLGSSFSTDDNRQIDPILNKFNLELVSMKLTFLSGAIDAFFENSDYEKDLFAALCRATNQQAYDDFLGWVNSEVFQYANLKDLLNDSFENAKIQMSSLPFSFS